ncbi:MAG: hypothetical protein RIQ81_2344 [Pseudomonadota bacterium]|jgi:hypothetical protein
MYWQKSAIKKFFPFIFLIMEFKALGHGESKPGPNGGHVRMPGAFHTELVPAGDKKAFKIFLLDLNFNSPLVKKSSVKLEYSGSDNAQAICKPAKDFFDCQFKSPIPQDVGVLKVSATRQGIKGAVAEYQLPLKFQ